MRTIRTQRGQTRRTELAVGAYRLLYHEVRKESRETRRFVLQARLAALLRILDADETRFYYDAIAGMAAESQ